MKIRNPFPFRAHLHVLMHTGVGNPSALRINVRRVYSSLVLFALVLALLSLGTILFFRELEVSRQLEERVLALEIEKKLTSDFTRQSLLPATPAAKSASAGATDVAEIARSDFTVPARLTNLMLSCGASGCDATVDLAPVRAGTAQGKLFLVLEVEAQRIGAATHTGESRISYFIYPGMGTAEEVGAESLAGRAGKTFRFSKVLQSTASFPLQATFRPIAVEAFVFDAENKLVSHQRRTLEEDKE